MNYTVKVNGSPKCPKCDKTLDGATATDGSAAVPKAGDASCCAYCYVFLVYASDSALRPMKPEEFATMRPENQQALMSAAMAARAINASRGTVQ